MKPENQERASIITIQAHPPERTRRRSTEMLSQLNGCCCCCCCCLHTLGSIAGATWAAVSASRSSAAGSTDAPIKLPDDEIDGWVQTPRVQIPVTFIYWSWVIAVAIVATLFMMRKVDRASSLLAVVIFFPLVQLGASLLTAIAVACLPYQCPKRTAWVLLGRITAWSLIGAATGSLIMVILFR